MHTSPNFLAGLAGGCSIAAMRSNKSACSGVQLAVTLGIDVFSALFVGPSSSFHGSERRSGGKEHRVIAWDHIFQHKECFALMTDLARNSQA